MQNVRAACTNGKLEFRFSFSPACMIIIYLGKLLWIGSFSLDFRFVSGMENDRDFVLKWPR